MISSASFSIVNTWLRIFSLLKHKNLLGSYQNKTKFPIYVETKIVHKQGRPLVDLSLSINFLANAGRSSSKTNLHKG